MTITHLLLHKLGNGTGFTSSSVLSNFFAITEDRKSRVSTNLPLRTNVLFNVTVNGDKFDFLGFEFGGGLFEFGGQFLAMPAPLILAVEDRSIDISR